MKMVLIIAIYKNHCFYLHMALLLCGQGKWFENKSKLRGSAMSQVHFGRKGRVALGQSASVRGVPERKEFLKKLTMTWWSSGTYRLGKTLSSPIFLVVKQVTR
jgi:hypothetical protein